MKAMDFKRISIRGRVAFSIVCLENSIKHFQLSELEWDFLLKLLWNYTSINMGTWHYQVAECIPRGVLNDTDDLSDLDFLSETQFWSLNQLYKKCNNELLEIIDLIFFIGISDLYSSIENYSPQTIEYLQEILLIMNKHKIPLPPVNMFYQFSITEYNGWGREFTREDVFRNISN
ncbi:hypothetical protein [Emticicia fluvialis]|uniref:hypothetical protein n=1 Tax=Emticicia fluvialis TaxID=2974474 RepID=UPI00216674D3|nr:hypothetical protein [Emticicia fluvialis]